MILNARRLKVVMVEGFPSFGTKAFVICCVTTEDSNTPSLAVELVQMCRCQYFTTGFATESLMTVLLRSDVISDINWSSPQIVYDIFIRSEIRSYLQLLQDEINWI